MYASPSDSTLLSSPEPRVNQVYTFFDASEDFIEFFSGRTGMHEILLHEDVSNVDIMLQPHGIAIAHSANLPVKPIEVSLWKFFYDMEFTRCLRLSVLNSRCPASQPLFLNPAQYALLQEMKLAVIRGLGLTEIFMEENGHACLYGSVESVLEARAAIKKIFDEHGLGDPEIMPSAPLLDRDNNLVPNPESTSGSFEKKFIDDCRHILNMSQQRRLMSDPDLNVLGNSHPQSSSSGRQRSLIQSHSLNSMANDLLRTSSKSEFLPLEPEESATQRASIRFFVNISDAPRLIGTRGATKRRIEHVTGCTILLHTDKRENSEFPVEVFSTSAKQCEIARRHILGFLASAHSPAERSIGSPSKIKEVSAHPKIHLDISPKKLRAKQTD